MNITPQPELFEELHDEFQTAELSFKPGVDLLWHGGRKSSVVRMLSLRDLLSSIDVKWGERGERDLGDFILTYMAEGPAVSPGGRDMRTLCSAMLELESLGFPKYLREGVPSDDSMTILGRIRSETSELHILLYMKMFEHLALGSQDERVWRPAMMLMSDIATTGDDANRQEMAALCLERIMMLEGQKGGFIASSLTAEPETRMAALYPHNGSSGIIPASDTTLTQAEYEELLDPEIAEAKRRMHMEKFDFARSCIAESMFLVQPKVQVMGVNALAIGQYRNAIGPMLALCLGLRLHNSDPDKTPTGFEHMELRMLLLRHLAHAYPYAGGDSETLPAIASHLQHTALLLMDPDKTMASYSLGSPLAIPALELAHSELSRLLDPKQVLHPHPSYLYDGENLIPRFPSGGLQQSALLSATELALNGYRPASSTVLRAMLELTGSFVPFTLVREKPPRQVREALKLMQMCVESLALAGVPGAKALPAIFISGETRPSDLSEMELAELAVPSLEIINIVASTLGSRAHFPSLLAARVVQSTIEAESGSGTIKAPDAFRALMKRRNEAFGGQWDSFALPDQSVLKPFLKLMDERRVPRQKLAPPDSAKEPVFLLTRLKR